MFEGQIFAIFIGVLTLVFNDDAACDSLACVTDHAGGVWQEQAHYQRRWAALPASSVFGFARLNCALCLPAL
jgi:hypothetical protein